MTTFAELRVHSEFLKLKAQRDSVISCLKKIKVSLASLPTDKLSLRSFNKVEKAIDEEAANLKGVDKKIALWFSNKGGEITDSGFVEFDNMSVVVMSA